MIPGNERRRDRRGLWFKTLGGTTLTFVVCAVLTIRAERPLFANGQSDVGSSVPGAEEGQRLLHARCAVCHSLDLVTQQRLDLVHWKATVAKMTHWGAQLSEEEREVLADYLAGRFSPETPAVVAPAAVSPREAGSASVTESLKRPHPAGHASRGAEVYGRNCLPCHGPAAMGGMAPKLVTNPILADDGWFWETVLLGRGAMPGWGGTLTDQDIADIQAWLKTLR